MHINGIWKDGADDPVCRAAVMADLEGFPGGSDSKDLTSVLETWVCSLGWQDPLEKGKATHSSVLAWRIPWTEEPGRPVHGVAKSRTRLSNLHFHFQCRH